MTISDKQPPAEKLTRIRVPALDDLLGDPCPVLDKGFIRVIDYMGNDDAIVQAARVSYGLGTESKQSDEGLIRYLMRHNHTTPFEMCEIKLHVKLPIFVARQWIRHRTANVNEYSARYSILASEFYMPETDALAPQSKSNKQGREGSYEAEDGDYIRRLMSSAFSNAAMVYDELLAGEDDGGMNLARESARTVLPVSTYTEWYWKIDLHNFLHFLRLRADPHAQYEIREYAEQLLCLVHAWVPLTYQAFMDYQMNGITLSVLEAQALGGVLAGDLKYNPSAWNRMSKREQNDLRAKHQRMLALAGVE